MRIAVVSDIHGNRTAFEAVLADLRQASPDLIFHGGDLADGGANPCFVVDRIRELGWPGVVGNADQMLYDPETLTEVAKRFPAIVEMAAATREALGQDRIEWLRNLPQVQIHAPIALTHASPESCWRSPSPEADDAELESVYGGLGQPVAIYGHVHRSFIRKVGALTVANSGSVSLSFDGDPRAAYLLIDDGAATIRRVEYDVARELRDLRASSYPHKEWVAKMLETARP